ncbi:type IV secretion system DNA-binding domain-containing protein (plasmid) [Silvanigrella paludirubra]|uniref:Type IV secretion system DNA-binding domain-containing protein n=1 Tax=Silvanigrella paludirubra TaxID=2499159 RepID=A0A6N6VN05_9BACT|nr:type IV secretion system DNA-binding domain-containing protein [Silvanigrella paludirubra]KAB8035645.1 type IV secretion system DNA-binding domain-containing protein [Silvanigrella paludirubra]
MNILINFFFTVYILCFFFLVFSTYIVSSYKLNSYKQRNILIIFLTLIAYIGIPAVITMSSMSNFLMKNYHFPSFDNFSSYHNMAFAYLREHYLTNYKLIMIFLFFISSLFMFGYVNKFFKYAKIIEDKYEKYDLTSKLSVSFLTFGLAPILQGLEYLSKQNKVGTIRELEEGNEVIRDIKSAENRLVTELLVRNSTGYKFFKNFRLPKHIEVLNLLIIGGMGAGKTAFLTPIILQFFELKYRSLILDNKGDFCELLGEKEGVTILSPFDARSPAWNVAEDVATELEAIEFISQLIPLTGGNGDFFALAARDIALGSIKFLQKTKPYNWNMNEVLETVASENILRILEEYHPGGLQTLRDCGYDPKTGKLLVGETSAGIFQNIRASLQNFDILARAWPKTVDGFSIKKWAKGEEEKTLFLIVPFKQLYPEISGFFSGIVIDLFVNETLNLPESRERRLGLFLDELGAIPRVKSLANGAKLLRGMGVCMFVGIQEVGVIRKKYEKDGGTEVILNAFSSKMVGRAETPEYAEYFVRMFGKNRYKKITRTRSMGTSGKYSLSLSEEQVVEDAISTGELSSIPPATLKHGAIFFLKISEMPVIFKLRFPIIPIKRPYKKCIEPEWMKRPSKEISIGLASNLINNEINQPKIDQNLEKMLTDMNKSNNFIHNENSSNCEKIKDENKEIESTIEHKKITDNDETITLNLDSLNF